MKKIVLFVFVLGIFLVGCATEKRTEYAGIDYSAYEIAARKAQEDLARAKAEQAAREDLLSEEEDFTSEEIASSYGRYTDVTVVAAAKRIKLGASATAKHMALFQRALDNGYKKALRAYRPSGFTYSISSVGAVNPLSDIEVSCILGEKAASDVGQQTCELFFNTITQQYNALVKEAKANAAL